MQELLSGLVGVLIGGLLGHWLSIGRDRRREFNENAAVLYRALEVQRLNLLDGNGPGPMVPAIEFCQIRRMLPRRKRASLDSALEDYEEAGRSCGRFVDGIYVFEYPERIRLQTERLQSLLPHR